MSDKSNKMVDELSTEVDKLLEPLKKKLIALIQKREKKLLKKNPPDKGLKTKKKYHSSASSTESD